MRGRGSCGALVRDGVKSGWAGMNNPNLNNIPALPKRELSRLITSAPITVRVHTKGNRKIIREFIISNGLVFQSDGKGMRLVNVVDNFIHAILTQ